MPYLSIQILTNGGTTNPPPGDYIVEPDSTHTITAIPYEGYMFDKFIVVGGQNVQYGDNSVTLTVPDNITVAVYAFFKEIPPPPAPAHITLQTYRWQFEPEGSFPYRPDDIRRAWRLIYTIKNEGGQPSECDITLYLKNAPPYIGERIAYRHQPSLAPEETLTFGDWVVPETKGNEYYVLEIVTTSTGARETYTLGTTPPITPPPTPPPTPSGAWIIGGILAALALGIAFMGKKRQG